jgi:hypothetical protein
MPEPTFAMTVDDDLPRTIRRERDAQREAREREAREREARERTSRERHATAPEPILESAGGPEIQAPAATITDFDVPFAKLAMFFIRAAFAAIPALIILMAFLWVFGQALQAFFPQLLKMKILIYMP